MFSRVSPDILTKKKVSDICASITRPFVYAIIDCSIYEVCIITRKHHEIYISNNEPFALACDDEGNLLVRLSINVVRLSPPQADQSNWQVTASMELDEYPMPPRIRWSHFAFNAKSRWAHNIPHEQRDYSYVKDHTLHYYNGSEWKDYTLIGSMSLVEQYVWWIFPIGQELLFHIAHTQHPGCIWKTQGNHAKVIWYGGKDEPRCIAYSSMTQSLYGLSYTVTPNCETYHHVSVYQHE